MAKDAPAFSMRRLYFYQRQKKVLHTDNKHIIRMHAPTESSYNALWQICTDADYQYVIINSVNSV